MAGPADATPVVEAQYVLTIPDVCDHRADGIGNA